MEVLYDILLKQKKKKKKRWNVADGVCILRLTPGLKKTLLTHSEVQSHIPLLEHSMMIVGQIKCPSSPGSYFQEFQEHW